MMSLEVVESRIREAQEQRTEAWSRNLYSWVASLDRRLKTLQKIKRDIETELANRERKMLMTKPSGLRVEVQVRGAEYYDESLGKWRPRRAAAGAKFEEL